MLHRSTRTAQTLLALAAAAVLLAGCVPPALERPAPEPELVGAEARQLLGEARALLRAGRAEDALARLTGVPMGPDDPFAADLLAARADAAFASRQPYLGVSALARREPLLEEPEQRAANQRRLWNRMQEAIAAGVPLQTPAGAPPVPAGWMELGRAAAASGGNPFRLRSGLAEWRERHPTHPAALGLVETLLAEYRAMTEYPRQVALLLPLSGRQEAAATAVRDGFVAAYLAQGNEGERPALRIYDTVALGPTAAYELAVRNGADFIVGPLLKEELAELATAQLPAVPSLALNWADDPVVLPGHMYQYALAPEEEATAAATRAFADGHRRALALVHDTDQGRRMAQSFNAAFTALGGEVLGATVFDPRASDFGAEIRSLLLLTESSARHQRLQSVLGRPLEYEPRRRQDVDFLFLAARPSEGLLIRPQLRFHYASDLPVYATSSIYDAGRGSNADLDGVLFADMPWRVGAGDPAYMAQFRAFGPNALERSGRLYAFGADAYRLVPLLHNRSETLAGGVEGQTGRLRVDASGRVQRELEWGRFQRGRVQHVPLPLRVLSEADSPES